MPQSDYDISDHFHESFTTVGAEPRGTSVWRVTRVAHDKINLTAQDGTTVKIRQTAPEGHDLPFSARRETPAGDEAQIVEGEYPERVIPAVEAYLLGFEE